MSPPNGGSKGWLLDPQVVQLNHGSFGATPRPVLDEQDRWRRLMEANPTGFVLESFEPALDEARGRLSALVGADPADLVFITNATAGVNAVVRSLRFEPGDELLTINHVYNACRNALEYAANRSGANVVIADVPFPIESPDVVVDSLLAALTERTRFVLIDHVTSPTGLVLPVEDIVTAFESRGVTVMVDGAHGPGMVPLDLDRLGASYYSGNCHKWLCAPKGSAFLWARSGLGDSLVPPVISHGWNDRRTDRPRFHLLFDYMGADDPTAHLAVPAAIDFLSSLYPGGLAGTMDHNRRLALEARDLLCEFIGIEPPAPDSMIGSLAAVPIPPSTEEMSGQVDPLGRRLLHDHGIQVPVFPWPQWPRRCLRISAAPYNDLDQYQTLIEALKAEL
ncbi:MAG TPA: aminotransferase class V-fold PLP-dependent enzyme [Acidimicrobiia bacterium]|nr:aminotransferase class V-fold PLP-dependent enzyme [Acidimicrobiia bacterium]